jgi:hypothetical protein
MPLVFHLKYVRSGQQRAKGLSDARNDAGVSKEEVKSEFSTALKFNLRGESTAREAHFSHVSATNFALKEYYRRLKSYSKNGTMSPSEAAQKARTDVLNMIQNKSGPFTVTGSIDAEGTQAFYNKFTPGNHRRCCYWTKGYQHGCSCC